MAGGRGEHERAERPADHVDDGIHVVAGDDRLEHGRQFGLGRGRFDVQAHEEPAGVVAGELLALENVAVRLHDRPGDRVHDSGLVGTDEGDHPVVRGGRSHPPRIPGNTGDTRQAAFGHP